VLLFGRKGAVLKDLQRVVHGLAAVHFPAEEIVFDILKLGGSGYKSKPRFGVLGDF
jgi:hypothetical protein